MLFSFCFSWRFCSSGGRNRKKHQRRTKVIFTGPLLSRLWREIVLMITKTAHDSTFSFRKRTDNTDKRGSNERWLAFISSGGHGRPPAERFISFLSVRWERRLSRSRMGEITQQPGALVVFSQPRSFSTSLCLRTIFRQQKPLILQGISFAVASLPPGSPAAVNWRCETNKGSVRPCSCAAPPTHAAMEQIKIRP